MKVRNGAVATVMIAGIHARTQKLKLGLGSCGHPKSF